jgi:hypothetical protein
MAETAIGSEVPFVSNRFGLDFAQLPAIAFALGLGVFLVGLALAWSVVRDIPLPNTRS